MLCVSMEAPLATSVNTPSVSSFDDTLSYALSELKLSHITLKEEQRQVIVLVYNRKDMFPWLPTGYGKSLCYQLLPLVFDHKLRKLSQVGSNMHCVYLSVVFVVSLMIKQVQSLCQTGDSSAIIGVGEDKSSGMSGLHRIPIELLTKECDLRSEKYRILYSSPEAVIGHLRWREMLLKPPYCNNIAAIVIDEAHCVSKWYEVTSNRMAFSSICLKFL